jgi:hypothetical protein
LIPEQLPAPHAEGTKTRSSSQSLVREEAKIGEEKSERRARASKWKKPEGIKIIGLVFCKVFHFNTIITRRSLIG